MMHLCFPYFKKISQRYQMHKHDQILIFKGRVKFVLRLIRLRKENARIKDFCAYKNNRYSVETVTIIITVSTNDHSTLSTL